MMDGEEVIELGGIKIQPALNMVTLDGEALSLEPKMVQVLAVLVKQANRPLTREFIIKEVWADYYVGEDSLNRAISQIRKALKEIPDFEIETIRGIGYQLIFSGTEDNATLASQLRKQGLGKATWLFALSILLVATTIFLISQNNKNADPKSLPQLKEKVVTSEIGIEYAPTVSPDNKYLAFLWNGGEGDQRHVYIKEIETQKTVQFSHGEGSDKGPRWSNDGTKLAYFTTEEVGHVLKVSSFLTNDPVILDTVNLLPRNSIIDWNADDSALIFSAVVGEDRNLRIHRYSFQSGKREELLGSTDQVIHYANARYSPDGTKLAVIKREKTQVTYPMDLNQVSPAVLDIYDLETMSPVFNKLFEEPIHAIDWKDNETLIISIEKTNQFTLGELDLNSGEILEFYNSDKLLREIVYNTKEQTLYLEVWYGNVNMHKALYERGQLKNRKPYLSSSRHDWAPTLDQSGNQLAFLSSRSGEIQVWIHHLKGGTILQASQFEEDLAIRAIAWDQSGQRIAVNRFIGRNRGFINIIDLDGRELAKIEIPGKSIANPSWSLDDQSLYFSLADNDGLLSNWKYEFSSKELTTLGIPSSKDQRQISRYIYFLQNDKSGIWRAPIDKPKQVELVNERLSPNRSRYWDILSDTLYMLNLYGYTNILEVVDLKSGQLIDSLEVTGFIPTTEPAAVFLKDGQIIFPTVDGLETEIVSLRLANEDQK